MCQSSAVAPVAFAITNATKQMVLSSVAAQPMTGKHRTIRTATSRGLNYIGAFSDRSWSAWYVKGFIVVSFMCSSLQVQHLQQQQQQQQQQQIGNPHCEVICAVTFIGGFAVYFAGGPETPAILSIYFGAGEPRYLFWQSPQTSSKRPLKPIQGPNWYEPLHEEFAVKDCGG